MGLKTTVDLPEFFPGASAGETLNWIVACTQSSIMTPGLRGIKALDGWLLLDNGDGGGYTSHNLIIGWSLMLSKGPTVIGR